MPGKIVWKIILCLLWRFHLKISWQRKEGGVKPHKPSSRVREGEVVQRRTMLGNRKGKKDGDGVIFLG